uniref:Uncharacterized protein n=1 Tax=Candidatus Kentrum sp. TUN TaxID=2126343 RepID=A0A450ZDG6_9GAMM|nr:MAG: hypothetical protein BECKTUN1418D_GA0071000_101122 [Candidatus Kentron sp. TUN]VFK53956.1 MAG: hypothetical protein BECKTUN1418F_GA0071002_103413 [Candidatus Kentron sp. TUN]VFK55964.1 MAG: hypothetical protein BECKTUN1418E_GA0071001_103512 [Candidatus Kentron sp. TUN]
MAGPMDRGIRCRLLIVNTDQSKQILRHAFYVFEEIDMYQQRTVSLQEVIDRINIGNPAEVSRLILSVSPCRSGTTVMSRVLRQIYLPCHYL